MNTKGNCILEIKFEKATISDIDALINVRNQSFYEDYVKYGTSPGYNCSKESMEKCILNRISYKIICNDQIIGNISVTNNNNDTYHIGCLCVIPDYENKGIGQKALSFIENRYPGATNWNLVTPKDKARNHYFYKKAGYTITKEYMKGSVKLVLFEKKINA